MGSSREYSEDLRFILSFMLIFLGLIIFGGGFFLIGFGSNMASEKEGMQHILGNVIQFAAMVLPPTGFLVAMSGVVALEHLFNGTAT